jgi:hypothetical protein
MGGCGVKFADDEQAITSQPVGRVPKDDIADSYNTVCRIAEKRSYVAATRLVTGASGLFDEEIPGHGEQAPDDSRELASDAMAHKFADDMDACESLEELDCQARRRPVQVSGARSAARSQGNRPRATFDVPFPNRRVCRCSNPNYWG